MDQVKKYKKDNLIIKQYETFDDFGRGAARDVEAAVKELLSKKTEINMVFAAAPSQNSMLKYLTQSKEIDFSRINTFHLDEYIGLPADAPQGFGNFLRKFLFSMVTFKNVYFINGQAHNPEQECKRYAKLLSERQIDIVCCGIGENGHLAFNDPGVADFNDPELVKIVELDEKCRQQQVNDGCFADISEVPKEAITLTIPAIMNADMHVCVVPTKNKLQAVRETISGPISEICPASILRKAKNAALYIDKNPALKLDDI